jgi:GalNAc-alpha-(1->4)-GalNAc-alpha-(1->3)-diNAcBac-PP-undecaprenol alpha-1,4-N-acetyl-D-galactosaminyltransferase
VATYSGRGDCHYQLQDGVRLVYLADEAMSRGRGLSAYVRRFIALRRLVRRERPDVVVSFLTNVNIAAIACSVGLGVPVLVSERIYPPAYPVSQMIGILRRVLYPFASRVVLQTSESLAWLKKEIPRAEGVVIPNPLAYPVPPTEPVMLPESFLTPGRRLLLGVGRLHSQKGFDALLDAFGQLAGRHPEWDLAVVGEGPERAALERQASHTGLGSRVVFPGHLGNMEDWYERADLYVLSSRFEGFPNSLAEAMAHGCAVVSYDCDTGPRDMIRDGETGLLVQPVGDPAALCAALDRLMGDEPLRGRLAAAALEVRDRFSLGRVTTMWDSLIGEVVATR